MIFTPRVRDEKHLRFIRDLPCLICGTNQDIHAAHIRAARARWGKTETGAGQKPDDAWTVPLCGDHHVWGSDAQHTRGEMAWWGERGIDPFVIALALYKHSKGGDRDAALMVIEMARGA